ncbi:MAG: Fic family protein [Erysipelotrichaceae bacterium]
MRDPYLYDDADILKNLANIKEHDLLSRAEADITNLAMVAVYNQSYKVFDTKTLQDIHSNIFGQIYDWAGEFRTIQIAKYEDVLGGDTVRYTFPKQIKKELDAVMKEVKKLKRTDSNDKDIVFRLERIIATIWHIHPFREGNTRTCIVFAVLLAKHLGFEVNHELFKTHSAYVRNALVWASQGIYSKHEYLERIFSDAILGDSLNEDDVPATVASKYESIGEYKVKNYVERPHKYVKDK